MVMKKYNTVYKAYMVATQSLITLMYIDQQIYTRIYIYNGSLLSLQEHVRAARARTEERRGAKVGYVNDI